MRGAAAALCVRALGWALFAVALMQIPSATEVWLILGTVVFAECLSAIIISQPAHHFNRSAENGPNAMSRLLLGWISLCLLLVLLFNFGKLPFFKGHALALLCMLALTLTLALMKLLASANATVRLLEISRVLFAAITFLLIIRIGGTSSDLFLASFLFGQLILLFSAGLIVRHKPIPVVQIDAMPLSSTLGRHADLFILPLLFAGAEALLYLLARCLSMVVPAAFFYLSVHAKPALTMARQQGNRRHFIMMAARLNLGFMLVGGSLGLGVLIVGPYLEGSFDLMAGEFQSVLLWVTLGVGAPALFGATETLLLVGRKVAVVNWSNIVQAGMLCAAILAAHNPDAVFVAACFAGLQLAIAAFGATILARSVGVWPGPTALLLRQIRLF